MRNLCNTCIHEEVCGIEDHGKDIDARGIV